MGLKADLQKEVKDIFAAAWEKTASQVVPDPEDLALGNDAREFERATILYADLAGSTKLVDSENWMKAGEIYKAYLVCAARLIRTFEGEITAYDGDRVMAVFVGNKQSSNAAKCGLKINWAVKSIVNPALNGQYSTNAYEVKQVVGIDTGRVRVARIGIRGGNDLVWIGRPANYAAKLTECRNDYPTWLTEEAYNKLADTSKYGGDPKVDMWKEFKWTAMNDIKVYGSNWAWGL